MTGRPALISALSILACAGQPAQITAHETEAAPQIAAPAPCLQPIKPVVAAFVETGTEGELRQEFEIYFQEVEIYLNCLNAETGRVRAEAQKAANEYSRALDRIPPPPYQAEPEVTPHVPMATSGKLNLDYRGGGG